MNLKTALASLVLFYVVLWAACVGVAVFSGGFGLLSAAVAVADTLAMSMCMSGLALCAVFLMR